MPYVKFKKVFTEHVPDVDRGLFASDVLLIHYWILERHNASRVMKQFSLMQLVPPLFQMPFLRVEKLERVSCDYTKIMHEAKPLWVERQNLVIKGKKDASTVHTKGYQNWYELNTRMRIGRVKRIESGQDAEITEHEKNRQPTTNHDETCCPVKHVISVCL